MNRITTQVGLTALIVIVTGCEADLLRTDRPQVVECSGWGMEEVSERIGPDGGEVGTSSYLLTIAPGGVVNETTFWLRPVERNEIRVEVVAESHETFDFIQPAMLTLGYRGCENVPSSLQIFVVDAEGEVLEELESIHDRENQTVSAEVDHLSIFVLGEP